MAPNSDYRSGTVPLVPDRINLLFQVWRKSDGAERSNSEVAEALSVKAVDTTPEALADARDGSASLADDVLGALAGEFGVDPNYLLSDDVISLHEQLVLLREVGTSGIKGIHLRGDQSQIDAQGLAELLRRLRERTADQT